MIARTWHGVVPLEKSGLYRVRRRGGGSLARAPLLFATLMLLAACGMRTDTLVSDPAARIAALLTDYQGTDRPGACVLARSRGTIAYQRCFGMADLESGQATSPSTDFRLASLTKQFTAAAVLSLVQAGRLDARTTLRQVFPDFPRYGRTITIHHLLTHTSGLIDYEDLMPADDTTQIRDAGVLALMMEQDSTYFPPGSAFRYSNSAYAVLAMVVERVSGEDFGAYLERTIFEPLGMTGTVAYEEGLTVVPHRAYGYSRQDDSSWRRTDQSTTSAVLGDGGIYTSLQDMNRWLRVVEGRDTLLAPAVFSRAFERATPAVGEGTWYGYGWYLDSYRGRRRYRHSGSTIGFRNEVQRFPDDDVTVLFLSNRNAIAPGLADALVDVFLGASGAR